VALFRRSTQQDEPTAAPRAGAPRRAGARSAGATRLTPGAGKASRAAARQEPESPVQPVAGSVRAAPKKDRPTPSRREAEAARRQRVRRTLSPKESRRLARQQNREQRMRTLTAREAAPEKALMRDYVDSRFNLGEFLLPSLVVILALSFFTVLYPRVSIITTIAMYLFILAVLADSFLLWRGFKRVLAERLPNAPTRGLMMYGINRAIQIRRFRMPGPRLKRGDTY